MHPLVTLLLLTAGCTSQARFGTDAARVVCRQASACDPDGFEALWDDRGSCVDDLQDLFGGDCALDHCDGFELDEALECLAGLRERACGDDEVPSACARVWTGCDAVALGVCLLEEGADLL